jgi:tetratricopeptide (TPR) repeat protein
LLVPGVDGTRRGGGTRGRGPGGGVARHFRAGAGAAGGGRLKPDYAEAYNNRGRTRYFAGDHDRGLADYTEVIRLKPDYVEAYNNRGFARHDRGDHDGALADYNEAIRLEPDSGDTYFNRSLTRAAKGDVDGSRADLHKAWDLSWTRMLARDARCS